ncbi:MAG TPA: hypothetical protein VMG62_08225, partial [Solirubrobacteraceae bacterium]|nr:hypothetical protein [Solirubrobacteraceae bacterium]
MTPEHARRRLAWGLGLLLAVLVVWFAIGRLVSSHGAKPAAAPVLARVLVPEGETRRQIALRARAA